jgi:hypothetical protein
VTSTTPVAGPSGPVSKLPLAASPESSVVIGQAGFAKQFQDFQELAQFAAVSSPGTRITAGTSGRSARQTASTTKTVAASERMTPEDQPAPAAVSKARISNVPLAAWLQQTAFPNPSVLPDSGKTGPSARPSRTRASGAAHEDRSTGSVESGVEQNASPATVAADSNAPISNVPLAAWLQQTAFPNPVQNLAESAAPVSNGPQSPAAKKDIGNSEAAALAAISLQPLPPQPPPVSAKHSVADKDGSESPASGASSSAAAAPEVAAHQAQAAAATAHLPFVEAPPLDTGVTPPAERSSTPEKAGRPVSGPDPQVVNAEVRTPNKPEPAPADLAVAVRVKAQTNSAASGESAPAKELRRVDLADAPPAASLHTETSRAGAWVIGEGPMPGEPHPAADTASPLPERLEPTPTRAEEAAPKAAAPLKDLSIQVGQSNQASVELRVVEREGELQVAVRTGDADLAHGLRQGLPELVDRLDQGGFRTEAWRPSGVVSAPEPSSQAQSKSSESRNADSQSQSGWSQQDRGQRDHNQSNRPRWVEELEGNLAGGGETSTGEFHGFSH